MIGALRAGGVSAVLMAESERMRTACTGAGSESSGIGASSSGAFLIGRLMFGLRMLTFSGWHVFGVFGPVDHLLIQSPKIQCILSVCPIDRSIVGRCTDIIQ